MNPVVIQNSINYMLIVYYIRQYCYSYYHKTPKNIKYLPLGYSSGMYKHIQANNSYNSYSSTSYDIEYLVNKPRKYNWMFIGMYSLYV